MRKGKFDISHYTDWNKSRINTVIDYYGKKFFKNKTLLEVGCGWADMGAYFNSIGANVSVSDAREEHINVIKTRHPELKGFVIDSEETEWKYDDSKYDIILHFGLLYHLQNPEENLKMVCDRCDTLIIETEVLDSDDPNRIIFKDEETKWDSGAWGMAFNGTGSLPSYAWVERILNECGMEATPIPKPQMANSGAHRYDWPRINTNKFVSAQRAMWFCKKK